MSVLLPVIKSIGSMNPRVLQEMTLGTRKLSYIVSDSIGPFFYEENMQRARRAPAFSIKFDAASTKRGGLSKDLELVGNSIVQESFGQFSGDLLSDFRIQF